MNVRTTTLILSSLALALPLSGAHCGSGGTGGEACARTGGSGCDEALPRAERQASPRIDALPGLRGEQSGIARLRSLGVDPTKGDLRAIYRRVAPTTVLIRSENGHGTGVLVDRARGLVLTNDHVVQDGRFENFELHVNVEFGAMDAEGVVQPEGHERDGVVLLTDPDRDLAVVRVSDIPPSASAIDLATEGPVPGMPVATVGHGNLGLVWAIKGGEVASIGRLREQLAVLVGGCSGDRTMVGHPDRSSICEEIGSGDFPSMRVIQSSAEISPGDSGGPLVNPEGQLVGVNSFGRRNDSGQWSSFHIHLAEVTALLGSVGNTPQYFGPVLRGPSDAPIKAELLDLDLDGRDDMVQVIHSDGTVSELLDVDQDSSSEAFAGDPMEVYQGAADFDIVVRRDGDRVFAFHDFDRDGRFERLFDQEGAAYEHREDGSVSRLPADDSTSAYAMERYSGASQARLATRSDEFNRMAVYGPLPVMFANGSVDDVDSDGQPDTLMTTDNFVAADLNQDVLPHMTRDSLVAALRSQHPGFEMAFIPSPSAGSWVWYDRDADGTLETGLRSGGSGAVVRAVRRAADGTFTELEELIGTLAYDATLVPAATSRARTIMESTIIESAIRRAAETGPWPMPQHGRFEGTVFSAIPASPDNEELARRTAVLGEQGPQVLWLFDLDHDSPVREDEDIYLEALAQAGRMDSELAIVTTGAGAWAFYDHRGDAAWDTVLFCALGEWDSVNAWTVESGVIRVAADQRGATLVRPSYFTGTSAARLTTLASEFFSPRFVETGSGG